MIKLSVHVMTLHTECLRAYFIKILASYLYSALGKQVYFTAAVLLNDFYLCNLNVFTTHLGRFL